jgi:hypothetical protein
MIWTMGFLVLLPSCANPCHDYCKVFIDRTSECGLGGPSGDEAVDACTEGVSETLQDNACETASEKIQTLSCQDFNALVCAQPTAGSVYDCPSGG